MKRLALIGSVVGLFLIVMLAASIQGTPSINPPPLEPQTASPLEETAEPSPAPSSSFPPDPPSNDLNGIIMLIFVVIVAAAAIVILFLVVRALLRAWRDRPMRIRDGSDVGFDVQVSESPAEPDVSAPVIRRGIDGALRLIDERPLPTDAIVAAWVGLEESAADAGIARGVSETPAEFALRIITRRAGISDAASELLRLYERVRFGGHSADEIDRDTARGALKVIEEAWR